LELEGDGDAVGEMEGGIIMTEEGSGAKETEVVET
jgi:hypothetical protein